MTAGAPPPAPPATFSPLAALSAVDGRYGELTSPLAAIFCEGELIRRRLRIEIAWLRAVLPHVAPRLLTDGAIRGLAEIERQADGAAAAVKAREAETRHDVKAAEYWLADELAARGLDELRPYAHFACTSWDVNNIAFSSQMTDAVREAMAPRLRELTEKLRQLARDCAATPMLARTHGQPASPTTVGKEFANFLVRLEPRLRRLEEFRLPAKMNGAVGAYNAHVVAAPQADWPRLAREFVEARGFRFAACTTQIEPYDDLADLLDLLRRINNILLDCCRDCWGYVSLEYFAQPTGGAGEVGSSTMPHKINPIDFENAEGNIGVANALLAHLADKLPVSRWQRDLSDSTALRAVGTALGHALIAWRAALAGLNKIAVNEEKLRADLDANWQALGEAAQTVLRAEGVGDAYERLKDFSRGKAVGADNFRAFVASLPIGDDAKRRLLALTPSAYCGLAERLAREAAGE